MMYNSVICFDYTEQSDQNLSYQQIFEELKECYRCGARTVRFDGNPLDWTDENKNIENVIFAAHKIGFFEISLFWNCKNQLDVSAKNIWIQLDNLYRQSPEEWNNFVQNIASVNNKNIYGTFTITNKNYNEIENVIKFVVGNPKIKSLAFTFFEDKDNEENRVSDETKFLIIDKIIELKRKAFPVFNTYRALMNEKKRVTRKLPTVKVFDYSGNSKNIEVFSELNPIIPPQHETYKISE